MQVDLASSTCNPDSLQQKQVDSSATSCTPFYNSVDIPKKGDSFSSNHGFNHDQMQQNLLFSLGISTMSLEDAQFLLLMHEQRIESLNSTFQMSINGASTNYASNNNTERRDQHGGSSYNRNSSRGRGRGGRFGGRRLYCQLCTKPSHHVFL
ncbi:hypothetical protein ACOSQ2_022075 [Xanthoceras sorbifolium]